MVCSIDLLEPLSDAELAHRFDPWMSSYIFKAFAQDTDLRRLENWRTLLRQEYDELRASRSVPDLVAGQQQLRDYWTWLYPPLPRRTVILDAKEGHLLVEGSHFPQWRLRPGSRKIHVGLFKPVEFEVAALWNTVFVLSDRAESELETAALVRFLQRQLRAEYHILLDELERRRLLRMLQCIAETDRIAIPNLFLPYEKWQRRNGFKAERLVLSVLKRVAHQLNRVSVPIEVVDSGALSDLRKIDLVVHCQHMTTGFAITLREDEAHRLNLRAQLSEQTRQHFFAVRGIDRLRMAPVYFLQVSPVLKAWKQRRRPAETPDHLLFPDKRWSIVRTILGQITADGRRVLSDELLESALNRAYSGGF